MAPVRVVSLAMLGVCLFAVAVLPALAVPAGWHKSFNEGLEAAARSGRPMLVVTAWKEKV